MTRAVVCVATTPQYQRGMARQREHLLRYRDPRRDLVWHFDALHSRWPRHIDNPYAFKTHALQEAANMGIDLLLWCDSSVVPVRSLEPLWKRIEHDGYWMSAGGWSNYEWTADSAYPWLFPEEMRMMDFDAVRDVNRGIDHVSATAFGLSTRHAKGRAFLSEYYRLATTRAFCGPWINSNAPGAPPADGVRCAPCGPSDVRGHRHDQTAASVIAWRLGFQLTNAPDVFAYGKLGDPTDERTILLADGSVLA